MIKLKKKKSEQLVQTKPHACVPFSHPKIIKIHREPAPGVRKRAKKQTKKGQFDGTGVLVLSKGNNLGDNNGFSMILFRSITLPKVNEYSLIASSI